MDAITSSSDSSGGGGTETAAAVKVGGLVAGPTAAKSGSVSVSKSGSASGIKVSGSSSGGAGRAAELSGIAGLWSVAVGVLGVIAGALVIA